MVTVACHPHFEKTIRKINDAHLKERVKQRIIKIICNPSVGKRTKKETPHEG